MGELVRQNRFLVHKKVGFKITLQRYEKNVYYKHGQKFCVRYGMLVDQINSLYKKCCQGKKGKIYHETASAILGRCKNCIRGTTNVHGHCVTIHLSNNTIHQIKSIWLYYTFFIILQTKWLIHFIVYPFTNQIKTADVPKRNDLAHSMPCDH